VLIRKTDHPARRGFLPGLAAQSTALDRRAFLRRSGIGAGSLAVLGTMPLGTVRKAEAAVTGPLSIGAVIRKNICTHCSVGCTVTAEVVNGVWVGQEPSWDSPINRGSHCAKGASVRELVSGERRLKYPMKLVNAPPQATAPLWANRRHDGRPRIVDRSRPRPSGCSRPCGAAADLSGRPRRRRAMSRLPPLVDATEQSLR
jgi:hypothetical protein